MARATKVENGNGADAPAPPAGPATDARGVPAVDPTRNVFQLVDAAIQRQDDLRNVEARHAAEIAAMAQEIAEQRVLRQDDLRHAEAQHLRELAEVRDRFEDRRFDDESKRIDAIRAVDVAAVQQAATVSATQAATLAAQVAAAAEAMRTANAAATAAFATAQSVALGPINDAIADLRRAQYEAQGSKINVIERQSAGQNTGLWVGLAISGFIALISIAGLLIAVFLGGTP